MNSLTIQDDEDLDSTSQVYQDNNENIMIQRLTNLALELNSPGEFDDGKEYGEDLEELQEVDS